jgi:phosphate transport system substrate-binding protein
VSYNLSGVSSLTLSGATIAKIFDGTIKNWNDPAIAADNPGVSLPSQSITPVHRSDSSGTTSNFTKYLSKAAPTVWTLGHGSTINWPGGQAASGNPGVATVIKQTAGAVGYVDYSTAVATGLKFASIKNAAGQVVPPTLAGASAAAGGATIAANLTYDPTNSPAANAYPITSPTWILVYKTQSNATKAAILKAFLDYVLTTAQGSVASKDDYAPLPASLDQQAIAQLSQL